jgi:hypothetical protein
MDPPSTRARLHSDQRGEQVTKPRRRQAGEGGISEYQTKAGPRFLIKYSVPTEDGGKRVVLKRGYPTRKAAATAVRDGLIATNPADKGNPTDREGSGVTRDSPVDGRAAERVPGLVPLHRRRPIPGVAVAGDDRDATR